MALTLTFMLAGCADNSRYAALKELGFERDYLDGYQDGCHSRVRQGKVHGEDFRQDAERMYHDPRYGNGWNDGYRQCRVSDNNHY
uniref:hypothetical protein n=1 Tax=Thaumasiovibrio occultus TaxID=1891184 RepID=UPI000B35AED6|nr:hypothetical protein [Thaumasiovibrio occultus]